MKRILFHILRTLLFSLRLLINEDVYTKLYILILQHQGVDIASYDQCGFIAPSVYFDGLDRKRIHIGRNVYLTHGTILLIHDRSPVIMALNEKHGQSNYSDKIVIRDIFIGNNVFIGMNSIILPGAVIEDNVVVGAGSIVKGELRGNSVYAGNPCKKIKTLT